ncbi:hypothetical protein, partial [Streptomyces sp. NPDC048845]|uniref:hypothetical protein n=1 Tax=Streptomyces sp. NPDC048845 TaxID=3155390 RepID=UPI003435790B
MTLPDGQAIDAVVRARARDASGTWRYELEVALWLRGDAPGRAPRAEPYPVTVSAPYPLVQPVAGESYDEVPGGPGRAVWRLQRRRLTDVGGGPVWVLHRPDCWTGRSHS